MLVSFYPQINKIIPSHHPQIYSYQHQMEDDHITADKLAVSNIYFVLYMCAYVCGGTYVWVYVCAYVYCVCHVCVCAHVCAYVCICVRMRVCVLYHQHIFYCVVTIGMDEGTQCIINCTT